MTVQTPPEALTRSLTVIPVMGIPEVRPGADLAALLADALAAQGTPLAEGDVLVVAQKIVSKAEDARVPLDTVEPSAFARDWGAAWGHDPRQVEVVLRESKRIVKMARGLIISETRHGFVCANAGVDLSNTGGEAVAILLPQDPDRSARALRDGLRTRTGVAPAVIVADSFGRPWRQGVAQVALGVAGLTALIDLRGQPDADGRILHGTLVAPADQLAEAAELVVGKAAGIPAAVVRGYRGPRGEGSGQDILRPLDGDLFR